MDVLKQSFAFSNESGSDGPPVRIAFLGTRHPHVMYRFAILEKMGGVEFVGFYEEDAWVADGLTVRLPKLKRFDSATALLDAAPELVMIHSLDPDVPKWAHFALSHGCAFKGLFLEKPGAANPKDFIELSKRIQAERPDLAIELGYELHYSESLAFARKVIREGVLGDITLARFHGGCPSGAGMDLWQSIPEDLGGIMQTEGCHTLENILDLFGAPQKIVSTIRKLPECKPHPVVGWIPDIFTGTVEEGKFGVGSLRYEDIASAMLEYTDKTIVMDLTAWEPTDWCQEWAIDIYGTNGSLHAIPDAPSARLYLREAKGSFPAGQSGLSITDTISSNDSDIANCYRRQFATLFQRVRGQTPSDGCCGLQTAADIIRVIDAAYQSARTQRWVEIDD